MIISLYVINKAGSLLFNKSFVESMDLPTNEKMTLASTLHGLSAFAGQLSPSTDNSGIEMIEATTFRLERLQTLTGMQFVALCEPSHPSLVSFLKRVYEVYSDYVLKNPFYSLDMPIRCELFDVNLAFVVEEAERAAKWQSAPRASAN